MLTGIIGVLAVVAIVRLTAARTALFLARSDLQSARLAIATGDRAAGGAALAEAASRVHAARAYARAFPVSLLAPVPLLGSPARALLGASDAEAEVIAGGRVVLSSLSSFPTFSGGGIDGSNLSSFHRAVLDGMNALAQSQAQMVRAERHLGGPASALLPPVSGPARAAREQVQVVLRSLDNARRGLDLLAHLTATDADYRILLLSQDALELRPTGGYVGSQGIVRFFHGTMALEDYGASEDLPPPDPPPLAPGDLAPWLPQWWGLSNANWWPDFPTSARAAAELYRRQGGGRVDGVLALTEFASERMLRALGPVKLADYAVPVGADGFDQRVVYEVELKRPLDTPRKRFLTELATALFDRLTRLPPGALPEVAKAMDRSVAAGDVQLWFADPARERQLDGTLVAGELPRTSGDFLMLVDANLSASKANESLVKRVMYRVHRRASGQLVADLHVIVSNDGAESPLNPYYNGFLRVYVPRRSVLLGGNQAQGDEGQAPDGAYEVFTQAVLVHPGSTQSLAFQYLLPPTTAPRGRYHLIWSRQAGTPNDALEAEVGNRSIEIPSERHYGSLSVTLRGNRLADWLRRRWIMRELGL